MLAYFIQNLFGSQQQQLFFGCVVVTVVISIVLHELAHGWVALWQGDDTPKHSGHMTTDPMVHMGGFSLLMLVLVGMAFGMMPVNPRNFRSKYGDAMVSAAGPAMNFLLAFIALTGLAVWMLATGPTDHELTRNIQFFLRIFASTNIVLGLFNLLPVPPLDGSSILGSFVPAFRRRMESLGNPMWMLFIVLMVLWNAPEGWRPFDISDAVIEAYLKLFGLPYG